MTAQFNSNFLENNFLSDDDWGARTDMDFSSFNVGGESTSESGSGGSPSVDEMMDIFSSTGGQQDKFDYLVESGNHAYGNTIDSPPLTPPDDQFSANCRQACSSPGQNTVDELLADLQTEHEAQQINMLSYSSPETFNGSLSSRGRSQSSGSCSSTSAYSSQSSTPPPVAKSVSDLFEQALVSGELHCNVNGVSNDEGFHEAGFQAAAKGAATAHAEHINTQDIVKHLKQANAAKGSTQKKAVDVDDFDQKVQEALRETNRLLCMHNGGADQDSNQHAENPPNVCQIMDDVLPNDAVSHVIANKPRSRVMEARVKRKASDYLKPRTKKVVISAPSTTSVGSVNPANPNKQPSFSTSVCPGTTVSNLQIPIQTVTGGAPVQLIVKKEPVNTGLFLSTAASRVAALPNNVTIANSVLTVPVSQGQMTPSMPASPYIIKDESAIAAANNVVTIPSMKSGSQLALNTGAGAPQVIKVVTNTNPLKVQSKILPTSQQHKLETGNVECKINEAKSSKPLMGSVGGPKKPIIPAFHTVNHTSPASNTLSSVGQCLNARKDSLCYTPTVVDNALITKRQQRMIKNRESACQSRQRKKEYVQSLEQQMHEYIEENMQLKNMNHQLKKRVTELEHENSNLRKLTLISMTGQRKAACVLMLVLFIGFNVHPLSFLANQSITTIPQMKDDKALNSSRSNWPAPVDTSFRARQLLSHEEQSAADTTAEKSVQPSTEEPAKYPVADLKQQQQAYWVDDLVKDCKKNHFGRIQAVLQDAASIPLQRLLRRKLKEELGIRVPLNVPRIRRISYSGTSSFEKNGLSFNSMPPDDAMVLDASTPKYDTPPSSISIKSEPSNEPLPSASCEHIGKSVELPNKTDSARVSDDLAQWVERHKVEDKQSSKQPKHTSRPQNPGRPSTKNTHKKHRTSTPDKTGVAVYNKRDEKLKKLLEAIDRRNDTVYVISFSQDHILLPAVTRNASRQTKMSLVLPTVAPNESYANDAEHQTMIQINCEVTATEYFRIRRDALPDDTIIPQSSRAKEKNLVRRKSERPSENPKRNAYHGSGTQGKKLPDGFKTIDEDATVMDVMEL